MDGVHQKVNFFYGGDSKGVAELNHGTRSEQKDARYVNVIGGDGQDLSKEDECRVNVAAVEANESHSLEVALVTHNPVIEKKQHQSPTSIVWWERFLPLRSLKVLLVENDDSTRQVVSALLRNCCYEVTAVANVLEAWKILEDITNHIDLVLTEVVMPCFSGIGLLCKIMSHKTCKTIPVIMMSSNDSMGIVFKCLSKGAVDFLVKPIRKNELRNLWQHVWRRCHSSSGSGSESGIEGQKLTKSKSEGDSDNNIDSNDEDNGSVGLNARNGSDNGSGTQSSWTKCAIEVDSPQSLSLSEQLAGPHDSTCPQIIHPRPETFFSKKMPAFTCMDCNEHDKSTDYIIGKDLEIDGAFRNTDISDESYQTDNVFTKLTGPSMDKKPENWRKFSDVVQQANCNSLHEPKLHVADQVGGTSDNANQHLVLTFPDTTSKTSSKVSKDNDKGCMELPELELSLKRLRSTREVCAPSSDERNVLKRSNLSAFSRYPTSAVSVEAPTGCGGSSLLDNSYVAAPSNQGSNDSSDYIDMGSINKNSVTKPGVYKDVSLSTIKCNHPTSAFDSVQPQNSTIQLVAQENIDEVMTAPLIGQSKGSKNRVQVQHHHHHYHHHHHHVHASKSQKNQDDSSLESLKAIVAFCSSSNEMSRPIEANADNYSLNGSNSSSNHGSDGKHGHSTAITMGGANMSSANTCIAENDGIGGDEGNGCGSSAEQNHFTRREAALNKFRQKRKERNFSKKVRYQSRKRLAEQRPRFRGQFVRRIIHVEHQFADN